MLITDKKELERFYSYNRVWQLVPTIERTKKGRLFATFYSGADSETLGNYCVLVKSDDDAKTWTEPIAVTYDGEMHRCFDPIVWIDPLGRLWFTWSRGHEDGVYGVICEDPDADELIWSEEFYIGRNVMMQKPVVLSTGEWLFPIAIWNFWYIIDTLKQKRAYTELFMDKVFHNNDNLSGANVYSTVDNGKTFSMIGGCRNIQSRSCDEHIIFEKENGVLVMMIRTMGNIARSYSYDRGKTWTDAEFTDIKNPSARFHIRKLKSGRLLMINHHEFNDRNNLTAFLSEDEGKTWPYRVLLDERKDVSYPDVAEGDDGYLYIIYDRERGGYMENLEAAEKCAREILVSKINETDILNGEITSPESFTKRIVSKLGKYEGKENLYPEFPYISAKTFIDTVSSYDAETTLEYLFVYYSDHFLSMTKENAKKIDLLLGKIKEGDNLKKAVEILELSKLEPSVGKKEKLIDLMIDSINNGEDMKSDVSDYYLRHIFEKNTGFTYDEFSDNVRLKKIKELLITTDIKASTVLGNYGLDRFIAEVSLSPEEYRKYNKKEITS